MQRLKLWQAALLAAAAIGLAVGIVWSSSGNGAKGAPVPPVFTGGSLPAPVKP